MIFSPNQIRLENNKAFRKYERIGTKIFWETLILQAENFDPQLMTDAYIRFYQIVFVDSAKREYAQIRRQESQKKDFSLDGFFLSTWKAWIKEWVLQNCVEIISGVNQRTLDLIRRITAESIAEGLNPTESAKRLIDLIGSKARAQAIARTEGTTANNMGTKRSAEDWEIQSGTRLYKVWIHSGNYKDPRPAHLNAQNKPIPKESNFSINGKEMEYPGDKKGGLEELVNCLCGHTYLSERLARKRYPDYF